MNRRTILACSVGIASSLSLASCASEPVTLWERPASASGEVAKVAPGSRIEIIDGPHDDENGNSLKWYRVHLKEAYIDEQYIDIDDCTPSTKIRLCKVID